MHNVLHAIIAYVARLDMRNIAATILKKHISFTKQFPCAIFANHKFRIPFLGNRTGNYRRELFLQYGLITSFVTLCVAIMT